MAARITRDGILVSLLGEVDVLVPRMLITERQDVIHGKQMMYMNIVVIMFSILYTFKKGITKPSGKIVCDLFRKT